MDRVNGIFSPTVAVVGEYVTERTRGTIFWVTEPDIVEPSMVAVICGAPLSFFAVKVLVAIPKLFVVTDVELRVP
jgi:hypothetical protein